MTPNLSILVAQLTEGNNKAFERIFYMYYGRVFNLARRYHLSIENAEEITQQVFIIIWEKRITIDPEKSFEGFLLSVTRNLIINYLKRKTYLQGYINYALHNEKDFDFITEDKLAFDELQKCLEYLISRMPPRRKEIFLLSRKEGMSYKEIAGKLSVTESTVNTQITKALEFLRAKLERLYPGNMFNL